MKTKRICAGAYLVSQGEYVVEVNYFEHLQGWVAAAQWDRSCYTDPVATYRRAKEEAEGMIEYAILKEMRKLAQTKRLWEMGLL